jgi:hypothetical protein
VRRVLSVWGRAAISPRRARTVLLIVPSSVLSGGSPRRLVLHAGRWILEVVRHVNVGQDLIRPTTQRLTGQRAIASYFKNNPDKAQLGKATQRLMQTGREGEAFSYTVEGMDWVANSTPPPRGDRLDSYPAPAEPKTIETRVDELEARAVVLTAVQEGLLTRLARLEAKLAQGVVLAPSGASARAEGRRGLRDSADSAARDPLDDDGSMDGASSSDEALRAGSFGSESGSDADTPVGRGRSEPAAGDDSGDEAVGNGSSSSSSSDGGSADMPAAPPEAPALPPRKLLTLPPVQELGRCVALLLGGDVTAKQGDPPLAINRTTRDCYAASILDDSDETVGMIAMDLKATVFLGGTLMMLPRTEIEQQLKSLTPGEDSIAASAEICNALSGAINGFQDQHVRVGALQKFEFKAWSWVTKPDDRRDLEDSFGGRTVVFSRPTPVQIG